MQLRKKSFTFLLAIMLARTSKSFVSTFSSSHGKKSIIPAAASAFTTWQSQQLKVPATKRWMSEGAPSVEKTEEEKAAIKAAREARK